MNTIQECIYELANAVYRETMGGGRVVSITLDSNAWCCYIDSMADATPLDDENIEIEMAVTAGTLKILKQKPETQLQLFTIKSR